MGRTLTELIAEFDVGRVERHSAVLELEKLGQFNRWSWGRATSTHSPEWQALLILSGCATWSFVDWSAAPHPRPVFQALLLFCKPPLG